MSTQGEPIFEAEPYSLGQIAFSILRFPYIILIFVCGNVKAKFWLTKSQVGESERIPIVLMKLCTPAVRATRFQKILRQEYKKATRQ